MSERILWEDTPDKRVWFIRNGEHLIIDTEWIPAMSGAEHETSLSEPMRVGSRRNGASLLASHARLGTPGAAELRAAVRASRLLGHLPVVQGALWPALGLDERNAASVSGYLFASGLTSAAVRLGAIGAIEAQRSLSGALPHRSGECHR